VSVPSLIKRHTSQVAKENFKLAGFERKITVKEGPAADSLKEMNPDQPFDLAFIDADKGNNVTYFKEAKRMLRSGGVIVSFPLRL
jgi:predicted O-methyltransferase YrrM